jgi:DNA-binding NarL/FixJ family response regulator
VPETGLRVVLPSEGGRGVVVPPSERLHGAVLDLERVLAELHPAAAQVRAVLDEALALCRRSLDELGRLPGEGPAPRPTARGLPVRTGAELRRLTPREREVVRYAAQGKSNVAIGALLGISARTVETHRIKAMQKLGLESLVALVHYAVRQKLVEP